MQLAQPSRTKGCYLNTNPKQRRHTFRCPAAGRKCKLGYHRVFNLILWVLYTGMQWKCSQHPERPTGPP